MLHVLLYVPWLLAMKAGMEGSFSFPVFESGWWACVLGFESGCYSTTMPHSHSKRRYLESGVSSVLPAICDGRELCKSVEGIICRSSMFHRNVSSASARDFGSSKISPKLQASKPQSLTTRSPEAAASSGMDGKRCVIRSWKSSGSRISKPCSHLPSHCLAVHFVVAIVNSFTEKIKILVSPFAVALPSTCAQPDAAFW
jgi:hypothetical protein